MTSPELVAVPASFRDVLLPHLPYAEDGELAADADLAALGLDSMGVVALLVDLEDRYGVEISDDQLTEETFATVSSLWATIADQVGNDTEAPAGTAQRDDA